ncbi:MAG: EamA family transporter, partial [Eubacteriales bacterium]
MRFSDGTAALFAVLAAALYALNVPLAKLFLQQVQPVVMAGLLYLGAGIGMAAVSLTNRVFFRVPPREGLTKKELPYTVWMVVLDIAAPIFLMVGISRTPSAHVSLLNNFEIVATALIALLLFHETVSARLLNPMDFTPAIN